MSGPQVRVYVYSLYPLLFLAHDTGFPFTKEMQSLLRNFHKSKKKRGETLKADVNNGPGSVGPPETLVQGPARITPGLNVVFLFGEQEARQRRQPPGPRPGPRRGGGSALMKGSPGVESWGVPGPGSVEHTHPAWPDEVME